MLGVPQGKVCLVEYQQDWPAAFDAERARLSDALGHDVSIEHIGSTAVPDTISKPLIDVMIGLPDIADHAAHIPRLETLGYTYRGEYGIPDRHFFTLGDPTTHHVHMVAHGEHFWRLNLLFRDHLRNNADARERYVAEKKRLGDVHADDRAQYTKGKDGIIRAILAEAGWRE
ncbi:MAG: GrpB family protein [Planctomycetota bacterium]